MVEPVQGEAGVILPKTPDYLKRAKEICSKHKVLLIADEVQSGLGRCGSMLASQGCRPDMIILGKALSGGTYPVSAVLCDDDIMDVIKPGQHGSTYGGNPTAANVAIAALKVLVEEDLCQRSLEIGKTLRAKLREVVKGDERVSDIRGKGLFIATEMAEKSNFTTWDFCLGLRDNGIISKPTHGNVIRLTPPLVISEGQVDRLVEAFEKTLKQF
jgi:ornithine--oxo-acid transaminase